MMHVFLKLFLCPLAFLSQSVYSYQYDVGYSVFSNESVEFESKNLGYDGSLIPYACCENYLNDDAHAKIQDGSFFALLGDFIVVTNRGSRNFTLKQGDASSGWKHIYDRHANPDRFTKKSKFDESLSQGDITSLLNKTLKHGSESSYEGKAVFEKRLKVNGVYKKYRATVNEDGTVRTFHPLG